MSQVETFLKMKFLGRSSIETAWIIDIGERVISSRVLKEADSTGTTTNACIPSFSVYKQNTWTPILYL